MEKKNKIRNCNLILISILGYSIFMGCSNSINTEENKVHFRTSTIGNQSISDLFIDSIKIAHIESSPNEGIIKYYDPSSQKLIGLIDYYSDVSTKWFVHPYDSADEISGKLLFQEYCIQCHSKAIPDSDSWYNGKSDSSSFYEIEDHKHLHSIKINDLDLKSIFLFGKRNINH